MRVLLIRFSSLGDILLQTSFSSWLKMNFPEMKIEFLTLDGNEKLIEGHPHIDEILVYKKQKGLNDLFSLKRFCHKTLRPRNFDLVIDLHGTNRSFLVKTFLPACAILSMDKRRIERWLLVKLKIDLLKNQPSIHERNLIDLCRAFGREYDKESLISFIGRSFAGNKSLISSSISGEKGSKSQRKTVILAPGASFQPKRWPVENFKNLAKMILLQTNWDLRVLAGPEDDFCSVFDELFDSYKGRARNLQGKLSLKDSMREVGKSSLVIGNDSVLGHVAESCSIPSFVVFGPTSESFGFRPHLAGSRTFSTEDLWCRPCSTTGSKKCFRKKQYCMLATKPKEVFEAASQLLGESHAV